MIFEMRNRQKRDAVLVVEDEALVRLMAADIIEEAGWEPIEAGDAQEALALIKSRPNVKVLFTDVKMPGTPDGVGLAECVHAKHPNIDIVVTSGERRIRDQDLPDDGTFLAKPYSKAELVRVLRDKLC